MQKTGYLPPAVCCVLSVLAIIFVGFSAGVANGLLGTGGGILLLLILRRVCKDNKDAFAAALFCILPLSVLSAGVYVRNGILSAEMLFSQDVLPYLIGAIPGGLLGAYLLQRLKLPITELIFAVLLLFAGWRMAFS